MPIEDPSGWVGFLAPHLTAVLENLPRQPDEKILLGVLGLRSATEGRLSENTADQVSFLIRRALVHLPGVFVLERTHLNETEWENSLNAQAQSGYWTSAWLLDGNVAHEANQYIFNGQMRSVSQAKVFPLQARASDLQTLSAGVVQAVTEKLQTQFINPPQNGVSEAQQFQAEAEWALRWEQFKQGQQAADASWALGNQTDAMGLLRVQISVAATGGKNLNLPSNYVLSTPPSDIVLDNLERAFDSLQEAQNAGLDLQSEDYVNQASDLIIVASKGFAAFYFQSESRTDLEQERLRKLRQKVRALVPIVLEAVKNNPRYRDMKIPGAVFQTYPPVQTPWHIYLALGLYSPLWWDTPQESATAFREAWGKINALRPDVQNQIKSRIIYDRDIHEPLVVAWETEDRGQVTPLRDSLIKDLKQSGDPGEQVDAFFLNFRRYFHPMMPELQKKVPPEKVQENIADFLNSIFEMRSEIVEDRLRPEGVVRLLEMADVASESLPPDALDSLQAFRKKMLAVLLEKQWKGDQTLYGSLLYNVTFTVGERDRLVQLIEAFQKADSSSPSYLTSYKNSRIPNATSGAGLAVQSDLSQRPALSPTRVLHLKSEEDVLVINGVLARKNRFYVRVSAQTAWGPRIELIELDPHAGAQQGFPIVTSEADLDLATEIQGSSAWEVDGEFFYFVGREKLFRFDRNTGKLENWEMPLFGVSPGLIQMVAGYLYISVDGGAIVRVDPKTMQAELLASARRRPAQTVLDDREAFSVDRVFEGEGGVVFILKNESWYYVWDEVARDFRKSSQALNQFSKMAYDRDFVLNWIGRDAESRLQAHMPYYIILADPGRTGRLPAQKTWPPRLKINGDESFPSFVFDAAAIGESLYVYYSGGAHRGHYLKIIDDQRDFSVPLKITEPPSTITYKRMTANDVGVLIYGQSVRDLLFFSRADIDNFPQ